jgi:tRNA (adenine57-N1/adenine58-N1)-methyltransferase
VTAEPFAAGETVLLLDRGENRRLITLRAGAKAHGHKGYLEHDRIIGAREGIVVRSSSGATYVVFRPRLSEYALEMPRRSAIVYPKDVGIILVWADIYPGATVVESGLGSGSLTLALHRAVGPTGQVIVYEQRADMIKSAVTNITKYAAPGQQPAQPDIRLVERPPDDLDATEAEEASDEAPQAQKPDQAASTAESDQPSEATEPSMSSNLIIREANIYDGIFEADVDRIVLDLPEPWRVVPHALDRLRSGGVIACYSPSIIQVQRTVEALEETRGFTQIESLEVLYRPWQIKGQAVRPVQQMVSHTAFLTFARRLAARGRRPGEEPLPADADDDAVSEQADEEIILSQDDGQEDAAGDADLN